MDKAKAARYYVGQLGLALIGWPKVDGKAPRVQGWNQTGGYMQDVDQAASYSKRNPEQQMGVV